MSDEYSYTTNPFILFVLLIFCLYFGRGQGFCNGANEVDEHGSQTYILILPLRAYKPSQS